MAARPILAPAVPCAKASRLVRKAGLTAGLLPNPRVNSAPPFFRRTCCSKIDLSGDILPYLLKPILSEVHTVSRISPVAYPWENYRLSTNARPTY
jgi:hypothetical protein